MLLRPSSSHHLRALTDIIGTLCHSSSACSVSHHLLDDDAYLDEVLIGESMLYILVREEGEYDTQSAVFIRVSVR